MVGERRPFGRQVFIEGEDGGRRMSLEDALLRPDRAGAGVALVTNAEVLLGRA